MRMHEQLQVEAYFSKRTRPPESLRRCTNGDIGSADGGAGRLFAQCRPTSIFPGGEFDDLDGGIIGSATARLGLQTHVYVAVTYYVGQPPVTTRTDIASSASYSTAESVPSGEEADGGGNDAVEGEVVVTCSDPFATGGGSQQQQLFASLQSYLQRVIEGTMDLTQLAINSEENGRGSDGGSSSADAGTAATSPSKTAGLVMAYGLNLSVQILDGSGGNLRDACLIACVAALRNTALPDLVWHNQRLWIQPNYTGSKATAHGQKKKLEYARVPIPLTIGVWVDPNGDKNHFIVDPTEQEEAVLSTTLTVVVSAPIGGGTNSGSYEEFPIVSFDMSGHLGLDTTSIALAVKLAQGRARELLLVLT